MTDVCPYTLGIAISGEVNGERLESALAESIQFS